ncbi:MAG: hypothetical protein R3F11_31485 [Verrucomicrobiales bacterium]
MHFDEPQPIPEELYSEYEERPFRTCTRCGETLDDFEEGYQLNKVWRRGECVFEFALCFHCQQAMAGEFSEESKQRLTEFQEKHIDFERPMSECAVCAADRDSFDSPEFTLIAACECGHMHAGFMVCAKCVEQMQELISKQTRGVFDKFVEENFPGVPADTIPLPTTKPKPVLV